VVRARPALALDLPAHLVVTLTSRTLGAWRRARGTQGQFHRGRRAEAPTTAEKVAFGS
jgi:hypothetical protein